MLRLIICVWLGFGITHAADFALINNSQKALVGAIRASISGTDVVAQFIPDYGVHVAVSDASLSFGFNRLADVRPELERLLPRLSNLLDGLDPGAFVSVAYSFRGSDVHELFLRIRVGEPESLEVWIDGEPQ